MAGLYIMIKSIIYTINFIESFGYTKFSFYLLIIFFYFLTCKITYADNAVVNLELQFKNIATTNSDTSPLYKTGKEYRRASDEINRYYQKFNNNVNLQRSIDVSWEIINYEFLEENYYQGNEAYHLFDITWHRFAMQFQRREGDIWGSRAFSPATSFNIAKSLPATIKGFGQVPTNSSSNRMPNKVNIFDIEQIVRTEDYRIIISRLPITQPFYIFLTSAELKGNKWEIIGEAKGASSCVRTLRDPFYFPFDKYGFDVFFKCYYPADVNIKVYSSEDLDISNNSPLKFSVKRKQDQEIHIEFFRDNKFRKIILPIISALFPLILFLFGESSEKRIVRLLVYLGAFFSMQYFMPVPLNVPKYNLLYIISRPIFLVLVIMIELNLHRKERPSKKGLTNELTST